MEEDCMNIFLQSIKALSLISMLSVSFTYPMSWVKDTVSARWIPSASQVQETVMREARRARWNFEVVKNALPERSGAIATGVLALGGLGALAYHQYNKPTTEPINPVNVETVNLEPIAEVPAEYASLIHKQELKAKGQESVDKPVINERIETPLHRAIKDGNVNEVKRLLAELKTGQQRLDVIHKSINPEGFSALKLANHLDRLDILDILIAEIRKLN